MSDYRKLREMQAAARKEGRYLGIGLVNTIEPGVFDWNAYSILGMPSTGVPEGCSVAIDILGKVIVRVGFAHEGQGQYTIATQLLADFFGVGLADVQVVPQDSLSAPPHFGPGGSRLGVALAGAVLGAAEKLARKLSLAAAHLLQTESEKMELRDGAFAIRGVPGAVLSLAQVAGAIQRRLHAQEPPKAQRAVQRAASAGQAKGMVIDGVGDLLSSFARCCRPVPPEPIAGYITLGRGVSIHRADCSNLVRLRDIQPQRVLVVDWGRPSDDRIFPVAVTITAFDRRGLVRDISAVLADEHVNIQSMNTVTDEVENVATMDVTVSVHGLDELSRLLSRISGLPNVIGARRKR